MENLMGEGIHYKAYSKPAFLKLYRKLNKDDKAFLKRCKEKNLIHVTGKQKSKMVYVSSYLLSFIRGREHEQKTLQQVPQ